jgi:hypothetical protein
VLGKSFNAETMEATVGSNPTAKSVGCDAKRVHPKRCFQPAKVTIE